MSTRIITPEKKCTEIVTSFLLLVLTLGLVTIVHISDAKAEWKIDLSRRNKMVRDHDARAEEAAATSRSGGEQPGKSIFDYVFDAGDPVQETVILNTDKGFLPPTVRLRKGGKYVLHVVNVNEKEKNVSFVLDAFSEHHGTFFGKVRSFRIEPKKEGVFSFQCPETSAEGRMVIYGSRGGEVDEPQQPSLRTRSPAGSGGAESEGGR